MRISDWSSDVCSSDLIQIANAGAAIKITYLRDRTAAQAIVDDIKQAGRRSLAVQTDVTEEAQVEALFTGAEVAFGTVSLLVNSAGRNMSGIRIADMSLAVFDGVLRADLYGPFLTCRRFVRGLDRARTKGRIVNISSIHERAPRPGGRSEEHTSELQSLMRISYAVFCLKKKQ